MDMRRDTACFVTYRYVFTGGHGRRRYRFIGQNDIFGRKRSQPHTRKPRFRPVQNVYRFNNRFGPPAFRRYRRKSSTLPEFSAKRPLAHLARTVPQERQVRLCAPNAPVPSVYENSAAGTAKATKPTLSFVDRQSKPIAALSNFAATRQDVSYRLRIKS